MSNVLDRVKAMQFPTKFYRIEMQLYMFGMVAGFGCAFLRIVRVHWHELCFYLHKVLAYVSMAVAVVARIDVFWPNSLMTSFALASSTMVK